MSCKRLFKILLQHNNQLVHKIMNILNNHNTNKIHRNHSGKD
jgi:hypothetical protein